LDAEKAFGSTHDWGALQLGPVFVSGRIDRIDASSDRRRVRIIDYKTGKVPTNAQIDEELLQPWLYALKVGRELGADHVETGYLSLNRRDPDWKEVFAGSLDGQPLQQAAARAVELVENFRRGHIEPRPRDTRSCQRCDARELCRRPLSAPSGEDGSE
jgi:RecB family exonuclease